MKVLVTGAAGFLGSHLVDMLRERGDEVRAMVRPVEDASYLRTLEGVEVVTGDLTNAASLKRAVKDIQQVYNVGAKTGPWGLEKVYNAINVWGLGDLIEAAMEAGVQRIVHTSSITVYGHHLRGIVAEDHSYHAEDNPYSRSKIAGEKLVAALVERGAPVVMVRPGWIYGPRDRASFARFASLIESGKFFLFGSGKNIVPIVYVRDVAQGMIKAANAGDEVIGQAYNLVDDRWVTQEGYFNTIADALHVPHVSRHVPFTALYWAGRTAELVWQALGKRNAAPPPVTTYGITLAGGDQRFSIGKARRELGFAPEYDVKRGVAEGVKWYLEARKSQQVIQPREAVSSRS
ncbi:NAD-dependent epimerase/dehydratase family protein [Ktedonosporobacter rubrisoli]|uniref:NAD-dependent epimerase/dehydratase family protein n=1 Tax=Ktedonosporobacter rubrisoli TaxID=2509675 RepID=A0A4P6JSB6_KTERU|nr:NAD-dependent epimerase/dehydratase family protein [Ktedonosporobacter rubrisoli]QBD78110.1 NAD-dependent epimerase/dehydratase family protein [Ktedonosporobacter rubrisoli]